MTFEEALKREIELFDQRVAQARQLLDRPPTEAEIQNGGVLVHPADVALAHMDLQSSFGSIRNLKDAWVGALRFTKN